jgi:hypothetical protein
MKGKTMEDFNEKNKVTKWDGTFRGISWEINLIARDLGIDLSYDMPSKWWTYYLILAEDNLPEDSMKDFLLEPEDNSGSDMEWLRSRTTYDYYGSLWSSLPWHGEITYYEKKGGLDGGKLFAKAGCDYNHSFDHDIGSSRLPFESIVRDVKATIDHLFAIVPGLKTRCRNCGKYSEDEHVEGKHKNRCDLCKGGD